MPSGVYVRTKNLSKNKYKAIGQKFGRLLVLSYDKEKSKQCTASYYLVRCDCGVEKVISSGALHSGHTKSCGCLRSEMSAERIRKLGSRTGKNHPAYLHGFGTAKLIFQKAIHARDKVCQYDDDSKCKGQLEAHHLDGNDWNNDINNGALLCRSHHKIVTWAGNQWRPKC